MFTLLLQVTIGIDSQFAIPQPIDIPIGIFSRLLSSVWKIPPAYYGTYPTENIMEFDHCKILSHIYL